MDFLQSCLTPKSLWFLLCHGSHLAEDSSGGSQNPMEHGKNVTQEGQTGGATRRMLSLTLVGESHLSPSCLT